MKKLLLSTVTLFTLNTIVTAQESMAPAKAEQEQKKLSKEEEKAKREAEKAKKEAETVEAFTKAGLTADEQANCRSIMSEMSEKSKAVKKDATLDEAAKKIRLDEINKEKNEKLKTAMGEAKYKLYGQARKAQKEAAKAATATEVKE